MTPVVGPHYYSGLVCLWTLCTRWSPPTLVVPGAGMRGLRIFSRSAGVVPKILPSVGIEPRVGP